MITVFLHSKLSENPVHLLISAPLYEIKNIKVTTYIVLATFYSFILLINYYSCPK
jgi:hypothetical protein